MIVFDTDKCFYRKNIDYRLLSIEDLEQYAKMFYEYSTHCGFNHEMEQVRIYLNRIKKTFRLVMDDSSKPKELRWFSIYKNGNLKTLECMFHFLNGVFGEKNNLKNWIYMPDEIDRDGIDAMYNGAWIKKYTFLFETTRIEKYDLLALYKAFMRNCDPFKENSYHFSFEDSSGIIKIKEWNRD